MDISARWDKILRDILENRTRSLLVIFTIAIGLAAVGTINNTVRIMKRDLFGQYSAVNPASFTMYITPFQQELENSVEGMREVEYAQAQRVETASITLNNGQRKDLRMIALPDFNKIEVNQLTIKQGTLKPGLRGILLERSTAKSLGLNSGDTLIVQIDNGKNYSLRVDGVIHDITARPYKISGEALGYVTMATIEWLGKEPYFNQMQILVAENKTDREFVMNIAEQARDRIIESSGHQVISILVPGDSGKPGEFWASKQINGILLVLQIMSILAIFLSAGLVINTISSVLVQQVKQIGIMRSVGATKPQIIQIYMIYVLGLSLVGTIISLPLGMLGSWGFLALAASFLNFDITIVNLPLSIILLQSGLGLTVPLGAAMYPILQGSRMSVYDAIYQNGLNNDGKRGRIETLLVKIKNIDPTILLSLRNTFRNKSRLGFTLITLTIAGAMFMAVFSSYSTVHKQIEELGRYIAFDASLNIPGGANKYTVEREALRVPEIKVAEGWASTNGFIVHPDGNESDRIEIVGLPDNPLTIQPRLIKGRWLNPSDTWQVVVNEDLLSKEPSVEVGNLISLEIGGISRDFEVVGVVSKHMLGARMYMNYEQLTKLTGKYNQVDVVRVLVTPGTYSNQSEQGYIGRQLEERFDETQLSMVHSKTRYEIFASISNAFNILLIILLLVASILAVIGGLGLTGTMGLNILERTREIGILRAVGASHRSVRQVVVAEGTTVSIISWILSSLISYPVGKVLAEAVIRVSFGTAPTFQYSYAGLVIWLVVIVLIGVISSLAPAKDAARLTVREVLNYE